MTQQGAMGKGRATTAREQMGKGCDSLRAMLPQHNRYGLRQAKNEVTSGG
jgi:hypothetical protein